MSIITLHRLMREPATSQTHAQCVAIMQELIKQAIQSGRPLEYSIYLGHLAETTRFPFNRVDAWQMALDMQRKAGGAA